MLPALRRLVARPGLALARVLTVTVVVAALTAVFAAANATLLAPLPFPEPSRLVRVYFQPPGTAAFAAADSLDALAFVRFRERTRTMDSFVGIFASERGVTGNGEPESIWSGRVSEGFFEVLGARTVAGRTPTADEYAAASRVVVLGHGFWTRRFGADRSVIGRTLIIDREPHTIVGVVAAGFEPGYARSEFWTPMDLRKPNPYFSGIQTIGRRRPGHTAAQASAELNTLLPDIAKEVPEAFNGWTMGAIDLREARYGARRPTILMLIAAVVGLALIAIFNLTNITLADVTSRRSEFALRAALGGSRLGIARDELTQCVVLAGAGGSAGLLIASALMPALASLDPSGLLSGQRLTIDWPIAAGALLTALLVMTVTVAGPVLRSARGDLAGDLAAASRRTAGGAVAARARIALVGAQVAVGIVLLASGALVVTTFQRTARIEPGFDPANLISAQLRLSELALPTPDARVAFVDNVLARLRETPGIVAASTTLNTFVAGQGGAQSLAFVEDHPTPTGAPYRIQSRRITPRYFEAMRIPLVRGRDFAETDRLGSQSVAIVSRSFAERFWPGQDPLNRRVKRGVTTKEWALVIGVVEDVRDVSIDQAPQDTLYTPFLQSPPSPLPVSLVLRIDGLPSTVVPAIKQTIWRIDPDQPLANVVTLDQFLHDSLGPQRFRALLVTAYATLGLLLATIGTYAVTARAVVERTREAGVRLALGGQPRGVWWTVASPTLTAVFAGAVAGILLAWGARALLSSVLPELVAAEWGVGTAAAMALVVAGCCATLMAARRVLTIDAARALQE